MGLVYEDITLKNAGDVINVGRGFIKEPEIRQATVQAMVDTGAMTLVIGEDVREELGLELRGEQQATLANEAIEMCHFTEPVEVHWKDRYTVIPALVLAGTRRRAQRARFPSGTKEVLLGAIPLEAMDLIVDPGSQQLAGAHGDQIIHKVK